jgi:cell division protein FtsW
MDVSIYRLRQQDILALCVLGLLLLGVLMVQSAATSVNGDLAWQWTETGSRHLVFTMVAIFTFFVVGHINCLWLDSDARSIWKAWPTIGLGVAAFLCMIVLIPHVGIEVNGARRWLPLGPVQVQPSELAKWGMVLFLAWWLARRPVDLNKFTGLLLTLVPIGIICLLVVIQDFGTAALIGLAAVILLLAGRVKAWHLAVVIPPALAMAVWFIAHKEYRLKRLMAFTDPWANPRGEGYHMIQSLLSFATGGLSGRGLGNGVQKLGYLPEDTTDFIFAVICEELGLGGAILVVLLYLGILWVAWDTAKRATSSFGRLMAYGIGTMIALQAAINIAVATVSVPTKGLSLPLVSAGGSGLVITSAALGMLYSICRMSAADESADCKLQIENCKLQTGEA